MKKILPALLLFLCAQSLHAQSTSNVFGELLIRLKFGIQPHELVSESTQEIGMIPNLKVLNCVNEEMNIWLFSFDEHVISLQEMLRQVKLLSCVEIAQSNHVLTERAIPNDPFFGQQWHHTQNNDHDIDTDLAWDVTTGGTTSAGDEIVVCVVELGGAKWNMADIVDNHWVNTNEIPDNAIDDDGNGYVDDYDGWNISSNSDNISEADHGTRVSSMIGATGNNSTGITGVNWNVKLMQVQIGGVSEANAIAGYSYALKMRKLYNETNGALGAFVVATNSSWGTDGAQAGEAELWCAMYDSLGVHGVLSCGSTTNSNDNVDVVGDLPTGCPSEFMVSVGRTNSEDVRASGGYGLTTIDLMGPGDNVYLGGNTTYGNSTGTSFSGPCVAGAIALLYSAPCNSFMQIVQFEPEESAALMKEYILSGVDQTAQLLAETVSGGRLNVNNSLNLMLSACDNGACIAPFGIEINQIAGELNYNIAWDVLEGMEAFNIRYRPVGNPDWIVMSDITSNGLLIENLMACTEYELQVSSLCGSVISNWSVAATWTTDGCCINPTDFLLASVDDNTATIEWNNVLAAQSYHITVSSSGNPTLTFENIPAVNFEITGLQPCTEYLVSIFTDCSGDPGEAQVFQFHTPGCASCDALNYCSAEADASGEHIQQFILGDINRTSANDGGYILVSDLTTTLIAGENYSITCVPGYTGINYTENFIVWIDFNSDGDFDEINEKVFDAPEPTIVSTSGNFTVPLTVNNGIVRCRVAMGYATGTNPTEPTSCGSWSFGEVEDYCVLLDEVVTVKEPGKSDFSLFPNPASVQLFLNIPTSLKNETLRFTVYNVTGDLISEFSDRSINQIDVSNLSPGLYILNIQNNSVQSSHKFIKE